MLHREKIEMGGAGERETTREHAGMGWSGGRPAALWTRGRGEHGTCATAGVGRVTHVLVHEKRGKTREVEAVQSERIPNNVERDPWTFSLLFFCRSYLDLDIEPEYPSCNALTGQTQNIGLFSPQYSQMSNVKTQSKHPKQIQNILCGVCETIFCLFFLQNTHNSIFSLEPLVQLAHVPSHQIDFPCGSLNEERDAASP
jgi:hypothetical protein